MAPTSGSGSVTFDGLASGIKTNEIVDAMVEASKASMRQLDRNEEKAAAHKKAYESLTAHVTDLNETARSMGSAMSFISQQAKSSDESILRVTAGQGAVPGVYTIEVKNLATGQRSFSAPQATADKPALLLPGRVSWTAGEQKHAIDVPALASLQDVADAINDQGGGLSASILNDGRQYRLQLTGTGVGEKNAIKFHPNLTGLQLDDPKNVVQPAQDATFVLDGMTTIRRGDNTINDVLAGLTFVLEDTGPPVRVRVTQDEGAMAEQVHKFVQAYNVVNEAMVRYTRFEGKHDPMKLAGDSTLNALMQSLHQAVSRPVAGATGKITAMSHIGISSARDGGLEIDETRLQASIANDSRSVAKLFGRDVTRNTPGIAQRIDNVAQKYTPAAGGQLRDRVKRLDEQSESNAKRRVQLELQAERYEASLRKQFADLEKNMSKLKGQNSFLEAQANNRNNKN